MSTTRYKINKIRGCNIQHREYAGGYQMGKGVKEGQDRSRKCKRCQLLGIK